MRVRRRQPIWTPRPQALHLLDAHGGPFDSAAYRRAVVETLPGVTDLSWAATGPGGVTAAVALVGSRRLAEALPPSGYGSIVASAPLPADLAAAFLRDARRMARARQLTFRTVAIAALEPVELSFARTIGQASVVAVSPDEAPRAGFRRLAMRSVRKAQAAGATVRTTADGSAFMGLYAEASRDWTMRYPGRLVLRLGELGVARFDEVWLGADPVAALMTLRGASHWMCWLAAQNAEGRAISASYLAYDAVLRDANAAVPAVSFGASAPGTSGLEFKRRLGAVEVPIHEWDERSLVGRAIGVRSRLSAKVRT